MQVTVKLYATLTDYLPASARRDRRVPLDVDGSATVAEVVERMKLPAKLIHLVLLNGVYVEPEARRTTRVSEGDAVAIWPPIAGG